MDNHNIILLDWPAYRPDLSPTEHLWDAMDRRGQRHLNIPTTRPVEKCLTTMKQHSREVHQCINEFHAEENKSGDSGESGGTPDTG